MKIDELIEKLEKYKTNVNDVKIIFPDGAEEGRSDNIVVNYERDHVAITVLD
jgi:hypothetical protein